MKTYICDACGIVIDDPYKAKMKEFNIEVWYDYPISFPRPTKRKVKIHLCKDCFHALNYITKKIESEDKK